MKLVDLDPEFIRWVDREEIRDVAALPVGTAEEITAWIDAGKPTLRKMVTCTILPYADCLVNAQGLEIDCPKCKGNHRVQIAFAGRGVLDHHGSRDSAGRPTRWQVVDGSGFTDLSLHPSIDCTPSNPNCWHGFITNGEIK